MDTAITGNDFEIREHVFFDGKMCEVVAVERSFYGVVPIFHYDLKLISDGSFFIMLKKLKFHPFLLKFLLKKHLQMKMKKKKKISSLIITTSPD